MKLHALASAAVVALSFAAATSAQADTFQFLSGDTTNAPTYNRALSDFSALSAVGTDVHYNTYTFTVSTAGEYIFNTTATFDSFVFLYENSFNPADATANGVAANDDIILGTKNGASGFSVSLNTGTTYTYVTTGFDMPAYGAYSTTILGPTATVAAPVPEVQTYLMMALGLATLGVLRRRQGSGR